MAHGSCRSIPRFDMLGALERCAPLMIRFGGHRQAAGLTLEAARIKELRAAVNDVADETLGPDDLMPRLRIDGDLTFRAHHRRGRRRASASMAPFGAGNPRPVFAARRVEIVDGPRTLKERHLKMALKQDGRIFRAIAWRAAEQQTTCRAQGGAGRRLLSGAESLQRRDAPRIDPGRSEARGATDVP